MMLSGYIVSVLAGELDPVTQKPDYKIVGNATFFPGAQWDNII
jgi:hypothetical protein